MLVLRTVKPGRPIDRNKFSETHSFCCQAIRLQFVTTEIAVDIFTAVRTSDLGKKRKQLHETEIL
jgi:hypothetical protein